MAGRGRPLSRIALDDYERAILAESSSPEERGILLSAEGMPTKEVARLLNVTSKTVCAWKRRVGSNKEGRLRRLEWRYVKARGWRDFHENTEWRPLLEKVYTSFGLESPSSFPATKIYRKNGRDHLLAMVGQYVLARKFKKPPSELSRVETERLRKGIIALLLKHKLLREDQLAEDRFLRPGVFRKVLRHWIDRRWIRFDPPPEMPFLLVGDSGIMILPRHYVGRFSESPFSQFASGSPQ